MLKVLVFSSGNDSREPDEMIRLLSRRFAVAASGSGILHIPAGEPELILLKADEKREFSIDGGCVVMSFSQKIPLPDMSGCTLFAFEPLSAPVPRCRIISCGLHHRDTITLSSIESDRALLSVQREFPTANGDMVEIGEYPLLYSGELYRALIASAALLLFCSKPLLPDSFEPPR